MRSGIVLLTAIFFISLAAHLRSQDDAPYTISPDSLLRQQMKMFTGMSLDKKWKYFPGDSPAFALKDYDDSKWEERYSYSQYSPSDSLPSDPIGWYRTKIKISPELRGKTCALVIKKLGAIEIYLNGKQTIVLGDPARGGSESGISLPIQRTLFVSFNDDSIQTIAVRFSSHYYHLLPAYLRSLYNDDGFLLTVVDMPGVMDNFYCQLGAGVPMLGIIIGILVALALYHLLLYLLYIRQKSGLFFSLFGFTLALLLFTGLKVSYIADNFSLVAVMFIQISILPLLFVFFAGYVYSIYYTRLPRRFYVFLVLSALVSLFMLLSFSVKSANIAIGILTTIIFVDCIRLLYLLVRQKYEGAWIITGGSLGFIGLMVLNYIIALTGQFANMPLWFYQLTMYGGITSLPLALSYYLARDFARTSNKLEEKLHEVELLSEKTLEQERHSAELLLLKEKESAKAIEAELRTQAAELQAKAAELQAQALEAENNRKTAELESARKLQLSMLPLKPPDLAGFEIATFIRTASEVGGDYYDFSKVSEEELHLCIGDATGHGARAGVMVTIAKSIFVSQTGNASLSGFPETLSAAIREMKLGNLFMCLLNGQLRMDGFTFVSAGMPPVLVYRAAKEAVEIIGSKALPLGAPGNFRYEENTVSLSSGDVLLLLSDGLIEMFNAEKEMFGIKRISHAFAQVGSKDPNEIADELAENINTWRNNEPLEDDVTLLVIRKN